MEPEGVVTEEPAEVGPYMPIEGYPDDTTPREAERRHVVFSPKEEEEVA